MKKEIGKISTVALLAMGLYLFGIFKKINIYSLMVIIPLAIAFIIPLGRIIVMAFRKDKMTEPD